MLQSKNSYTYSYIYYKNNKNNLKCFEDKLVLVVLYNMYF